MEFLGLDIHSQVSDVIVKVTVTILGKRAAYFSSSDYLGTVMGSEDIELFY